QVILRQHSTVPVGDLDSREEASRTTPTFTTKNHQTQVEGKYFISTNHLYKLSVRGTTTGLCPHGQRCVNETKRWVTRSLPHRGSPLPSLHQHLPPHLTSSHKFSSMSHGANV
ncbi:unnamed protein product, partial [Ectocarpus sp. 12 AP-2014]